MSAVFDLSTNTAAQRAVIEEALSRCDFPWEVILPALKAQTGRDAVPVTWANLSNFFRAPHYLRHDHLGLLAHVLQIKAREAALGLAYYDGRIVLEQAMVFAGETELAGAVFLAEGSHMTDFFYLSEAQREAIFDAYHPGADEDLGAHGHSWFEPCVSPETRLLTLDLKWVQARNVKVGDTLLGIEEFPGSAIRAHRKLIPSTVVTAYPSEDELIEVRTDQGSVIVNRNHLFLGKVNAKWKNNRIGWGRADRLIPGHQIKFIGQPWTEESGNTWVAGFLDGEGSLSTGKTPGGLHVSFAQNPGIELDYAVQELQRRNFDTHMFPERRSGRVVRHAYARGGTREALRLLGTVRPKRLLRKWLQTEERPKLPWRSWATVQEIRHLGRGPIISLETSAKTYIAEGYISHNSSYYEQVGENYMIGFIEAFAPSYDTEGWGFAHETTVEVAAAIRQVVLPGTPPPPPPPPPPPSGVTVVVDGIVLPPDSSQILVDRTWVKLRAFEAAGYVVTWDSVTRTAYLSRPA